MAPQLKMDIVILQLKYDPSVGDGCDKATVEKKTTFLKGSFSRVKNWFNGIMTKEVAKIPRRIQPYFLEWIIATSDPNLFVVNNIRYDKIYIIFGDDQIHWIYYSVHHVTRRLSGSDEMPVSFCGCCIDKQYVDIMHTIQETASKKRI